MVSPAWPAITIFNIYILKVTRIVIKAGKWEEEATATDPECIAVVIAPLTSHCCILDKLSLMVITSSHLQLSFVHNEA